MSNFKNNLINNVGTSFTTLYEVLPDDNYIVVIGLTVTNLLVTDVTIKIRIYDSSETTYSHIEFNRSIPSGSHYVPVGGKQKLVLELNDKIEILCSDVSGVDVALSYMVN